MNANGQMYIQARKVQDDVRVSLFGICLVPESAIELEMEIEFHHELAYRWLVRIPKRAR